MVYGRRSGEVSFVNRRFGADLTSVFPFNKDSSVMSTSSSTRSAALAAAFLLSGNFLRAVGLGEKGRAQEVFARVKSRAVERRKRLEYMLLDNDREEKDFLFSCYDYTQRTVE